MEENEKEAFLHDWVVEEIQKKYSKEFNEIKINTLNNQTHPVEGEFPDIIFGNYGQIMMIGEVETISKINSESIKKWKKLHSLGYNCILFVPKDELKKVRDLCFDNKLIERIKISPFSVEIPIS
ncbi:MAG: hypothetical protein VX343_00805 [Thermodesulfobacteriota bacterium]|nr:hypothetical protein [Thermodesulfobacteriota bacterium]|tara:strand:+ start:25 stop:396 length:372 start_codon:yes stop_codon:yes gene_type:complete